MTLRNLPELCLVLLLAGCATAPIAAPKAVGDRPFANSDQAVAYHVFMGELAAGRNDSGDAVAEYLAAARLSPDASLSAHAALLAYENGNLDAAQEATRRWQALAPGNSDALQLAAVLAARRGAVAEAARDFAELVRSGANTYMSAARLLEQEVDAAHGLPVLQAIVAANPKTEDAHFALAHAAMSYKRYDLAESEARATLTLDPRAEEPLVLLARALVAEGRAQEALPMLAQRVHAAGDDVSLDLAYAALLAESKHDVESRQEFEAVLKAHPENAEALYTLGLMTLEQKDVAVAQGYFTRLLKTGKRIDDAEYFLGSIAETEQRYPEALERYHLVQDGDRWLAAQAGIGRCLTKSGAPAAAAEFFDDLVANDPDGSVDLRLAEGQMFSDAGQPQRALAVYNAALAAVPGDHDLLYARALLLEQDGDAPAAEHDLSAILKHAPDDAEALNALGYTLTLHTNRYAEARDYIQRALVLQPGDPAILDSMGWVEHRLGHETVALQYLRQAYAAQADPEIAAHLVEVLLATGDAAGARTLWLKASADSPDNSALRTLAPRFNQ